MISISSAYLPTLARSMKNYVKNYWKNASKLVVIYRLVNLVYNKAKPFSRYCSINWICFNWIRFDLSQHVIAQKSILIGSEILEIFVVLIKIFFFFSIVICHCFPSSSYRWGVMFAKCQMWQVSHWLQPRSDFSKNGKYCSSDLIWFSFIEMLTRVLLLIQDKNHCCCRHGASIMAPLVCAMAISKCVVLFCWNFCYENDQPAVHFSYCARDLSH